MDFSRPVNILPVHSKDFFGSVVQSKTRSRGCVCELKVCPSASWFIYMKSSIHPDMTLKLLSGTNLFLLHNKVSDNFY